MRSPNNLDRFTEGPALDGVDLYDPGPPNRTFRVRYVYAGRGKPMPYELERDATMERFDGHDDAMVDLQ